MPFALTPRPDRHVVRYIPAGAVSRQKAALQIDARRQAFIVDEAEGVEGVVVLGGAPVLGGEAVVDGGGGGEGEAEVVAGLAVGGEEGEAAAVEVDKEGEFLGVGGGDEEAEPEVAGGVDGDVGEGDRGGGGGGRDFGVHEAEEAAVDGSVGADEAVEEE